MHDLVPDSLDQDGVHTLRVFVALLAAWTVTALAVAVLLPAMFALGRSVLVNVLAVPLLVIHVVATAIGSMLFGVEGVVAAMAFAPALFVAALVVAACKDDAWKTGRELAGATLRFSALAACSFGTGAVLGILIGGGTAGTLVAGVTGAALYVLGARVAAPRELGVVVAALRPARP